MHITTDGIIGGAVGSILMFCITKIFEIWQKENEHKNALRKTFFERKLAAAERAVALWYSSAASMSAISALYEKSYSFAEKSSGKMFDSLNKAYFAQFQKILESADQLTNAIYLYFDIDSDTSSAKQPLQTLFDASATIQNIALSMSVVRELKQTETDEHAQQFLRQEEADLRNKAIEQLKQFSVTFDTTSKELTSIVKSMRQQMKKYDK